MNVAFFLTPKNDVSFLYTDATLRQGLERLKRVGYTAIPVLDRNGKYMGMIREGDFLWYIVEQTEGVGLHDLENVRISDILKPDSMPPEPITVSIEKIVERAIRQNFVPIVDGSGIFIGIVTRGKVMQYLNGEIAKNAFAAMPD